MEVLQETINLLFGSNPELRQIIGTTLRMSLTSTLVAIGLGVPLGTLIGIYEFKGKRILMRIINTLMGLPPVVAGLLVFFLLSRSGPLGEYKLLYSVTAMVTAQIILITPIAIGLTSSMVSSRYPLIKETAVGIGLSHGKQLIYTLYECRSSLFSVLFTGFGRAISEVGAAQIVGGNIQYKTRVMTTAIVLETNKGNFEMAIALGIVLLVIAFCLTCFAQYLKDRSERL